MKFKQGWNYAIELEDVSMCAIAYSIRGLPWRALPHNKLPPENPPV